MNPLTYTTLDQILAFAQIHDWGRNARIIGNCVMLYDDEGERHEFTRMSDIRAWAGY